jgi:FtsZ-binding cell division protein ZapB
MANDLVSALQACRTAKDQVDAITYSPALDTPTRNTLQGISIDLDHAERTLLLDDLEQKIQQIKDCATLLQQGVQQLQSASQQLKNITTAINTAATAIGVVADALAKGAAVV